MALSQSDLIKKRFQSIQDEVPGTKIVAVSKTFGSDKIAAAIQAGILHFGENRIPELLEKASIFENENIHWHFIGHIQSNKLAKLLSIKNLYAIHSVDSLKLLQKILKTQKAPGQNPIKLFLQINTSGEKEKGGLNGWNELSDALEIFQQYTGAGFVLEGLMTMGKLRTENFANDATQCFQTLLDMKNRVGPSANLKLSMGMSQDYKLAYQVGTDYIRIGTAIFGVRD